MSSEQGAGPVTFVNVFEVDPDNVDEFIVGWKPRSTWLHTPASTQRWSGS